MQPFGRDRLALEQDFGRQRARLEQACGLPVIEPSQAAVGMAIGKIFANAQASA